jgi:hypothetical protein
MESASVYFVGRSLTDKSEEQKRIKNPYATSTTRQSKQSQCRGGPMLSSYLIPIPQDAANRPSWTKDRSRTATGQPCSALLPSENISSLDQRRSTAQQVVAILVIPPSCSQEATRLAFPDFLVDLQLYRLVV